MEHVRKIIRQDFSQAKSSRAQLLLSKILLTSAILAPDIANAECLSTIKGPVAVDVQSCGSVNPDAFDSSKEKFRFLSGMDTVGRQDLLNQYRGIALKGLVVRSHAVMDGFSAEKGVLQGKTVLMFLPPGSKEQCSTLNGKRIAAQVQERCCDGAVDAPCLIGTGLTLSNIKITGDVQTDGEGKQIAQKKPNKDHGKDYKEAEALYRKKNFKGAIQSFKKADASGDMDLKGLVKWGFAARNIEDCPAALVPLKRVYDIIQAKGVWTEDEMDSRRGLFLLARCHAKMGEPSNAVFYLNGFLLEPKKYRSELQQSLSHKDFGWIHTSKEYKEYSASAREKLGQK